MRYVVTTAKRIVSFGAATLMLSMIAAAIAAAPASASIGPNPKLVGTYNIAVAVNPNFGGGLFKGQITLVGDGSWTGNALSGRGCSEGGTWLESGKTLALSDLDPGGACDTHGAGLTWMVTVLKGLKLGSPTAPGYVNSPYQFNATWDGSPAPKVPTPPHASTKIGKFSPQPALVGTYNASATLNNGDGTFTGQITLNNDGTWTSTVIPVCAASGTWLATTTTISLSDNNTGCGATDGVVLMAVVGAGPILGSPTSPGYLNSPFFTSGSWYASHT